MMKINMILSLLVFCPLIVSGQNLEIKPDTKGRLGYFDSNGKKIISCQYEEAEPFVNGVAKVRKDGKYGLINEKGKAIGGLKYTVMEEYANTDYYIVCDGGSIKEDKKESLISKLAGSTPKGNGNNVALFKGSTLYPIKDGKWGVIDKYGKILIEPDYDELSNPIDGIIYVNKGGKYGFYNEDFTLVLKPTYNFIGTFNNLGLCWVKNGSKFADDHLKGGKMSIIDRTGKLIIPMKFENVCTFAPSDNPVYSSKAITDLKLVPFQAMPDSEEPYLWFASKGTDKPGIIDIHGNVVLKEKKYDNIFMPTDGMMKFSKQEGKKTKTWKWGFLNIETQKETLTDAEYIFYPFNNGISKAAKNDSTLYYFVDKDFHEISERYTKAGDFFEEHCVVGRAGKFGALDRSGKEVIPLEYDDILTRFSEGVLGAYKDGKWGFISPENKIVIPFEYDKAGYFENGIAVVSIADKWGQIDKQNKIVLPIEWKNFLIPEKIPTNYYWVQQDDNLYYYYDMNTHQITYPEKGKGFYDVELFNDKGYARVMYSIYYGAIYQNGAEYVPCQFDNKQDVEKAIFYLNKNNLKGFKEVDMKRFKIILRGKNNTYKLSERILAEDWDY